jgi:hypothetical protein
MCGEQLEVEHSIFEDCCLVVEFDSDQTMLVIWDKSHGTARLQFADETSP